MDKHETLANTFVETLLMLLVRVHAASVFCKWLTHKLLLITHYLLPVTAMMLK